MVDSMASPIQEDEIMDLHVWSAARSLDHGDEQSSENDQIE